MLVLEHPPSIVPRLKHGYIWRKPHNAQGSIGFTNSVIHEKESNFHSETDITNGSNNYKTWKIGLFRVPGKRKERGVGEY